MYRFGRRLRWKAAKERQRDGRNRKRVPQLASAPSGSWRSHRFTYASDKRYLVN